jgi:hypothetical protein
VIRRTPIRRMRTKPRRGDPEPAVKAIIRALVYRESGGRCEVPVEDRAPDHMEGVLPEFGDVRERWHLVHIKAKRVHGWGRTNLCGGCPPCHRWLHNGKKPVPSKAGL